MKYLYILVTLFLFNIGYSQQTPVIWSIQMAKTDDGNSKVMATAIIEDGWHLYSQNTALDGPVPTSFTYTGVELIGKTIELTESKTQYSDLFEMDVTKFTKKAEFEQSFKPKAGAKAGQVVVNFMCCNNDKCLPPSDVIFDFRL